jgi:psiF repeat-containing protein
MKMIVKAAVFGVFAAAATGTYAQATPEMQRLSDCNALANQQKVMKFSERKPFVDACMRGETPKKTAAAKKPTKTAAAKQEKTHVCNKQASDRKLKGDDRKKYMNQCMKA